MNSAKVCCVPSNDQLIGLHDSIVTSLDRPKATSGSTVGMTKLDGGEFWMGSSGASSLRADGESPERLVTVTSFYVSSHSVTNDQFSEFARSTGYRTEAERFGWSFVFRNHLPREFSGSYPPATPWWVRVDGANWAHPEGPDSSVAGREHYPVVHVSWSDAAAYCGWAGTRLPTEAEWEFASRGGLDRKDFPWGDELVPGAEHRCNVWQGRFPEIDTGEDGFTGVAPVNAFQSNAFGLYNTIGNVWEWCFDYFNVTAHRYATLLNPAGPSIGTSRVLKGGSFLCHESYCRRYRNSARIGNSPDTASSNIGFRVVRDN